MWLPTRAQIDSASRHAISIAGTAFAIFGLQAKGVSLDQVKAIITSLGTVANDILVLAGMIAPIYATLKAAHSASPTSQAQSITAQGPPGTMVVTSSEIAKATPDSPNIVSKDDVKVVSK